MIGKGGSYQMVDGGLVLQECTAEQGVAVSSDAVAEAPPVPDTPLVSPAPKKTPDIPVAKTATSSVVPGPVA